MFDYDWARQKRVPSQKINIKLETNVAPPTGANYETWVIPFKEWKMPIMQKDIIMLHDISTAFAGKSNAIISRRYIKGRDWYDFMWYAKQGIEPNYKYMTEALRQSGDLPQSIVNIDKDVYIKLMKDKIMAYNDNAINSIRRGILSFIINTNNEYSKMKNLTTQMLLNSVDEFEANTRTQAAQNRQANYTSVSKDDLLFQIVNDTWNAMKTMNSHDSLLFAYKRAIANDEATFVKERMIKDALSTLGYEGKNALPRYVANELSKTKVHRHDISTQQKHRDSEEHTR